LLSDGKWHTIKELRENVKLEPRRFEALMKFLEDYGFIVVDAAKGTVKLNEGLRRLSFQEASP